MYIFVLSLLYQKYEPDTIFYLLLIDNDKLFKH